MKFLDSNILAYAFYDNEHTAQCQAAIKEGGVTDTLNLAEACFIIEKETGNQELAIKSMRGLMKGDITIADVDSTIIFEALKRTQQIKLSIFDTIHYVCALVNNCENIVTYDKDFAAKKIPRVEP